MGDAIHRHPPSNGLGSNTSIQDSFNLAWKLAMVVKGQAGLGLLDTYSDERAPVAKQIVTRANQSIAEFGPIFESLGMGEGVDPVQMQKNLNARTEGTEAAEHQREAIRKAIAFKKYEFDAHGVEMNQRYRSAAIVTDGQIEPAFALDADLHYQPTTWPGARLPHAWLYRRDTGAQVSTLDLCGHGRFTLLTGLGGEPWVQAAAEVAAELGLEIGTHVIGPRQTHIDHSGDWARASEIRDSGCLLVRPDHHVSWRAETLSAAPKADLLRVLRAILAR
jgi:2,4-dichlorophenol 6-monooxygenase